MRLCRLGSEVAMDLNEPKVTKLRLLFSANKTDVTEDLSKDLLSWSYSDKETGQADEISLTLQDKTGKWASTWKPDGGEVIRAYLSSGTASSRGTELYCGSFYVDTVRFSGSPKTVEIRAVSIPLSKPIRRLKRTRAWESKDLKSIASGICSDAGMSLVFDSSLNPTFDRVDQNKEADLSFINRLCEDSGLSLKVTDNQMVIFDQEAYESKDPVATFVLGESNILRYDFETAQSESYKSVTVKWRDTKRKTKDTAASFSWDLKDPATKKTNPAVMSYTYTDPNASDSDQEYYMKRRATSQSEAKRLAKAKLRSLNSHRMTGSMTVVGDPMLSAGTVIACEGIGAFDGNFIVEEANHSYSSSGYTTDLRLRRVNNDY